MMPRSSSFPKASLDSDGNGGGGGGGRSLNISKRVRALPTSLAAARDPRSDQSELPGPLGRWSPSQATKNSSSSTRLGLLLRRRGSMSISSTTKSASGSVPLSREGSGVARDSDEFARTRSGSFNYSMPKDKVKERFFDGSLSGPFAQPMGYRSLGRGRTKCSSERSDEEFTAADLNSLDEINLDEIQCLLPNGIILDMLVHPDDELCHIKQVVINRATTDDRLPLRGCLNPNGNHYVITIVTSLGKLEECYDEKKTLREVKPFQNMLKFSKRTKHEGHYQFKTHVGTLIGKSLHDFEELRNCEVNDFRWRMKVFANKIAQERKLRLSDSSEAKIKYQYPPRIVSHPKDKHNWSMIKVRLLWDDKEKNEIPANATPSEIISWLALEFDFTEECSQGYFIKTVGEDSYLVDNHRMIDYEFIREHITIGLVPKLIVTKVETIAIEQANETIYESLENDVCSLSKDLYARNHSLTAMSLSTLGHQMHSTVLSTTLKKPFSVTIDTLNLSSEVASVGVFRMLGLQMGLFHGGRLLCPMHAFTFNSAPNNNGIVDVQQTFQFDILISDLPRMVKLCVAVYEKKKGQIHPLFWVNTNLFDYRAKLKWKNTFHMWNYTPGDCMPTYQNLSPLRQSICNPNRQEAADLILSFADWTEENCWVEYPVCESLGKSIDATVLESLGAEMNNNAHVGTINKLFTQELKKIADRDPLHDLTVQEKDLIWKIREYCLTQLPELLPRIIDCVDYSNQSQVIELANLLERWSVLKPERALQLLDYAYPDENVRRFAVRCLRQAPDCVILQYLLQLAQALKHENYFHCDLVEFLLERALNNQHIGHYLFWELKAEMNSPSVGLLFGLVLEAYLTAAPEHLRILEHQNMLLEKCRATQSNMQKLDIVTKSHEKAKNRFEASTKTHFDGHNPYVNFVSPLNPGLRCWKIKLEQCKLMNSKMRPQMLSFQNVDSNYEQGLGNDLEDIVIIYKKGDDLRQDRLTLQLLKVMDLLWKDAGLDFRLNSYRCTSTDIGEGFIEVVQQAETICRIQMTQADFKTTAVFRKGLLLSWLKSHNPGEESMRLAQFEFTQSCAGYSVAMYILGIGDRHNDNIMVKTNGQLFHIDFGHFLGNFKHKFGIKRERVPMVLSSEFVEVIKADFGRKNNFEHFRRLCERAFLTIRKHGSLIISLLAMMISTGLPELSSEQDLNIIRSTLHLDRTEEDALDHFRKDFNESLRNAWTISLDWWFHMMNQVRSKGGKS